MAGVASGSLLYTILQCIDIIPLPIKMMKELVLFLINISIPCPITVCHSLGICLDLGQVFPHLDLLSLGAEGVLPRG